MDKEISNALIVLAENQLKLLKLLDNATESALSSQEDLIKELKK